MENEKLRRFLQVAIRDIQLECIKVEIDYPSAQFSEPERQGMVAAFNEVSAALGNILDEKPIRPSLVKLLDQWFDMLMGYEERSGTAFQTGYKRALRSSIGDMEYLLDE